MTTQTARRVSYERFGEIFQAIRGVKPYVDLVPREECFGFWPCDTFGEFCRVNQGVGLVQLFDQEKEE